MADCIAWERLTKGECSVYSSEEVNLTWWVDTFWLRLLWGAPGTPGSCQNSSPMCTLHISPINSWVPQSERQRSCPWFPCDCIIFLSDLCSPNCTQSSNFQVKLCSALKFLGDPELGRHPFHRANIPPILCSTLCPGSAAQLL